MRLLFRTGNCILLCVLSALFYHANAASVPDDSGFIRIDSDPNKGIFSSGFTVKDVNEVLTGFSSTFKKGDLAGFMALFDENVKTDKWQNRSELEKDYADLFDGSFDRSIKFTNASWHEADEGKIWGDVDFILRIGSRVDGKTTRYSGTMRIYFKKYLKRLIITALFYVYDK